MSKQCSGSVWRRYNCYRCSLAGVLEHDGGWWCSEHHPPTVQARKDAREAEKQAALAAIHSARRLVERDQSLKEMALEWMRREKSAVVKEWEEEL